MNNSNSLITISSDEDNDSFSTFVTSLIKSTGPKPKYKANIRSRGGSLTSSLETNLQQEILLSSSFSNKNELSTSAEKIELPNSNEDYQEFGNGCDSVSTECEKSRSSLNDVSLNENCKKRLEFYPDLADSDESARSSSTTTDHQETKEKYNFSQHCIDGIDSLSRVGISHHCEDVIDDSPRFNTNCEDDGSTNYEIDNTSGTSFTVDSSKSKNCSETTETSNCVGNDKTFSIPIFYKESGSNHVCKSEDESEEDDADLEEFYLKMKTPLKERISQKCSYREIKDFVVDDSDEEYLPSPINDDDDDDDECFYIRTTDKMTTPIMRKPILPWSERGWHCKTPNLGKAQNPPVFHSVQKNQNNLERFSDFPVASKTKRQIKSDNSLHQSLLKDINEKNHHEKFLLSLDHNSQSKFTKQFSRNKVELVKKLYSIYNSEIFYNKLPENLDIQWNARLLTTAGQCVYKKRGLETKTVSVHLSTKVCDTAERVRDTLIHELCHAASWLINNTNDGHGPYFQYWSKKVNSAFPSIPVVSRCHSYSISTKFTYRCTQCGYQIGRHSKSLDIQSKVCGYCQGAFELLSCKKGKGPTTPQTPNRFALFVKENFAEIKSQNRNSSHRELMNMLSNKYAACKISESR